MKLSEAMRKGATITPWHVTENGTTRTLNSDVEKVTLVAEKCWGWCITKIRQTSASQAGRVAWLITHDGTWDAVAAPHLDPGAAMRMLEEWRKEKRGRFWISRSPLYDGDPFTVRLVGEEVSPDWERDEWDGASVEWPEAATLAVLRASGIEVRVG